MPALSTCAMTLGECPPARSCGPSCPWVIIAADPGPADPPARELERPDSPRRWSWTRAGWRLV